MSSTKPRILITGAGGFIGQQFASSLLTAGLNVIMAVRNIAGVKKRFPH